MKPDRNRAGKPSELRVQPHGDDIAQDHGQEIDATEPFYNSTGPGSGLHEKTISTAEIDHDLDHHRDEKDLDRQEKGIGNKPRIPAFHGRQKGHPKKGDQGLPQYSKQKKKAQYTEQERITSRRGAGYKGSVAAE